MKKPIILIIFFGAVSYSFAQRALEQIDFSSALSVPIPSSAQIDDDFSADLPKDPPPPSVDIVRPDESESFSLSSLSKSKNGSVPYLSIVLEEAKKQNFDPEMVLAVIKKESSFNPKAKSSVGAMGLMQLMPDTAKWLGLKDTSKLFDPATNIKYGIKYLRYLFSEFSETDFSSLDKSDIENQSIKKSIAAYNSGPGNVRKYDKEPHNGIPPFKETKSYVKLVSQYFIEFEEMGLSNK
ncbi:MAG: lytic transglycosylase domain-containing protein [Elusimicrobiota bacterium]